MIIPSARTESSDTNKKENAMTTIKNLTPHAVNIIGADGSTLISFEPDSTIPAPRLKRAKADMIEIKVQGGVQVPVSLGADLVQEFEDSAGLPDAEEGVLFIVSRFVAVEAAKMGRKDFLVPDLLVRDDEGNIIGCKALATVSA